MRPFVMSRGLRGCVEYGSIEYSAVSQPPVTACSFIQRGTASSIVTAQMTRVLPIETSTEPLACGATFNSKLTGRISSGARPSFRCIDLELKSSRDSRDEDFAVQARTQRSNRLDASRRSRRSIRRFTVKSIAETPDGDLHCRRAPFRHAHGDAALHAAGLDSGRHRS